MKKILIAIIALLGASGAQAQQKVMVDQIAAVVGGSAIYYSEVVEQSRRLVEQRRRQGVTSDRDPINEALEVLLTQKLLYTRSLTDSIDVQTADIDVMVEQNVQGEIARLGSLAAVEAFYRQPLYAIKDRLRRQYTEARHAQMMEMTIRDKVTITPGEVERFYRTTGKDSLPIIPEQYVYAQITKYPASTEQARQRVRERLIEMRERVLAGTRFDVLARMYSVDPGSAVRGGEMDPTPKETFVKPFADALARLKPGQVSEVVETEFGFHLIQLIDVEGNLYHCRHILMRPIFTSEELATTTRTLDSLARLIRADSLTFEKAALEHSDDKYSKLNGGVVSNNEMLEMYNAGAQYTSTRFPKEELPPTDFRYLSTLKPGQMSEAFLTQDSRGNETGKLVKLLQIIPTHGANINEDYLTLENLALEQKQQRQFESWFDGVIASTYIHIDEAFRGGEFENKHWVK